jgi:hypothetical protein
MLITSAANFGALLDGLKNPSWQLRQPPTREILMAEIKFPDPELVEG